jgi:hypothetical protein
MVLPVVENSFDPVTLDAEHQEFEQMFQNHGKKLKATSTAAEPELPPRTAELWTEPRKAVIFVLPTHRPKKPTPPVGDPQAD